MKYIYLFDRQTQENKVVSPNKEPTIMFQKQIHKNYKRARRKDNILKILKILGLI